MFTLKLYSEGRTRIVAAESFTVYSYSDYAKQITTHQKDQHDDAVFYVGTPSDLIGYPGSDDSLHWYDRAIIENGAGKTTEMIQPPMPAATSSRRNLHATAGMSVGGVG